MSIGAICNDVNYLAMGGSNCERDGLRKILRNLREDADKTQTQIAAVLGTSQTMYARYERGANELPIHHLITLSKYYGVSTDYILGLSKER